MRVIKIFALIWGLASGSIGSQISTRFEYSDLSYSGFYCDYSQLQLPSTGRGLFKFPDTFLRGDLNARQRRLNCIFLPFLSCFGVLNVESVLLKFVYLYSKSCHNMWTDLRRMLMGSYMNILWSSAGNLVQSSDIKILRYNPALL